MKGSLPGDEKSPMPGDLVLLLTPDSFKLKQPIAFGDWLWRDAAPRVS